MKGYQRILSICGGVSLLVILLLTSVTALLTDKEQYETIFEYERSTVDVSLIVDIDGVVENESGNIVIDPGEDFTIEPWIKNIGSGDVYVFMELDIPVVLIGEEYIPIFSFETSDDWALLKDADVVSGCEQFIYCFGTTDSLTEIRAKDSMDDGPQQTTSLITTAAFSNIKSNTDLKETLIIKAYAVTTEAYENGNYGDPIKVWNATVKVAGE